VLNIRVPFPPLNPSASMRARQDEDNDDALDRPLIDTCGWDPGRQNGLHLLLLVAPDAPTQGRDDDRAEHESSPSSA
jgi:hypothetical protein